MDAGVGTGRSPGALPEVESPLAYRAKDPLEGRREACVGAYLSAFRSRGAGVAPRPEPNPDEAKGARDRKGTAGDKGTNVARGRKATRGRPSSRASSNTPKDAARAVLGAINAERARAAMPPLRRSGVLELAARVQATDMAARGYRDHVSPEGCTLFDRAIAWLGYPSGGVAENLADGGDDAQAIVAAWLASPGHRANILHPEYTESGIALARDAAGRVWWAQVFGDAPAVPSSLVNSFECPAGWGFLLPPGIAGVGTCATPTHVRGPFPEAMRARCRVNVTNRVCGADVWPRATYIDIRGRGWCPHGAVRDPATSLCLEGRAVIGPLPQALRAACLIAATTGSGDRVACEKERWDEPLLRAVWAFARLCEGP